MLRGNDNRAMDAVFAIHGPGSRIPVDISVAGSDNSPVAALTILPLTTVRRDFCTLGEHAVDLLINEMNSPAPPIIHEKVGSNLVDRNSVTPPNLKRAMHSFKNREKLLARSVRILRITRKWPCRTTTDERSCVSRKSALTWNVVGQAARIIRQLASMLDNGVTIAVVKKTWTEWAERLYDAYIFDMDGTIYLGDELLPGAKRMLDLLRKHNLPVRFLSNNPTKGPKDYLEKLEGLGIKARPEEITSTAVVTASWIKHNHPDAVVFPIGEKPLVDALESSGLTISDDAAKIDIVVASYDRTFDYFKLQTAFDALWFHKRAFLMGTNPDRYCPFPGGRGEPDCAAIIAAIEACTQEKCRLVIGKPNPIMLQEALRGLTAQSTNTVMAGDRLATDISMAVAAGMDSAMPLTGDSTIEEVLSLPTSERPTIVLERIDQLLPKWIWEEEGWEF